MAGTDVRRARRWFWALTVIAILAMGGLYRALGASPGPGTALLTLLSGVVLLLAAAQAARILTRLTGNSAWGKNSRPPGNDRPGTYDSR